MGQQTLLNLACLAGLYAACWTGRLGWPWFLGAVGLSMAWVTPALLVEGLRIYARAVYSVPPASSGSSAAPPSSGSTPPADVSQRTRAVEPPRESLPPGVAGLMAWARTWGFPRPAVAFGALLLVALLGLEGCAGNGSSGNGADVLAGIWKAVTVGCQGVRLAEPLVDGLRRSSSSSGSDASSSSSSSSSSSGSDASSSSGSMDRMDAGL